MALKVASQSPNIKRRYPGNLGEHDLRQALDLLFLLKGKSYQKKSPEFIIPTTDEFFSFCKFVSDDIFQKTSGKKLHRSLSYEKINYTNYLDFFENIVQTKSSTIVDRMCLCIEIVFYALFVYFYTGIYMKISVDESAKITETNAIATFKTHFVNPLNWFCTHTMPSLEKHKKDIVAMIYDIYQANIHDLLDQIHCRVSSYSLYKMAQAISDIFDSVIVGSGVFDNILKKPVLLAF
jgi:hypothetical protein